MRLALRVIFLVLALGLISSPALAHKVNLFAYAESGRIYTESYFPDGRMVEGGKVLVYDDADNLLTEGTTDADGLFDFPIPKVADLKIVIEATMGHKNSYILKKADVEAGK